MIIFAAVIISIFIIVVKLDFININSFAMISRSRNLPNKA